VNIARRVLVVDDDAGIRATLAATLEDDFQVVAVASGDEAVTVAASGDFDAVVLDVEMPGMDGYEACKRLRALPQGGALAVLFHSAHCDVNERLRGYEAGGDDYLAKPFDPLELKAKLTSLMHRSERQWAVAGQLEEMTQTALTTADMVGEVGVVLDCQRELAACATPEAVARCLLDALSKLSLDGCVRIHADPAPCALNARGPVTVLEGSILDHLERLDAEKLVHGLGPHAGFRREGLRLFVRDLCIDRPADMDQERAERMGRHVDNIALLVDATTARLATIEAGRAVAELADTKELVQLACEALSNLSAREHVLRMQVREVFERLRDQLEDSFISLALNEDQEQRLSHAVHSHGEQAIKLLDSGLEIQDQLRRIIESLRGRV
jgi:CheY-like chemotaxis protein